MSSLRLDLFRHKPNATPGAQLPLSQQMPAESVAGLRAVFLLAGTRKQETSWNSRLGCYGIYWRPCVFLCAHPFNLGAYRLDDLREFYLDDVLVHEIAHHVDRQRLNDKRAKESFAHAYVQKQWSIKKAREKRKA